MTNRFPGDASRLCLNFSLSSRSSSLSREVWSGTKKTLCLLKRIDGEFRIVLPFFSMCAFSSFEASAHLTGLAIGRGGGASPVPLVWVGPLPFSGVGSLPNLHISFGIISEQPISDKAWCTKSLSSSTLPASGKPLITMLCFLFSFSKGSNLTLFMREPRVEISWVRPITLSLSSSIYWQGKAWYDTLHISMIRDKH